MTTIIGTGEVGALHSREELEEMQRLPLQRKIQITTARIIEWYQHYDGKVYVAFSGGKDSTTVVELVYKMLLGLDPDDRHKNVYIVSSDTLIENPLIKIYLSKL